MQLQTFRSITSQENIVHAFMGLMRQCASAAHGKSSSAQADTARPSYRPMTNRQCGKRCAGRRRACSSPRSTTWSTALMRTASARRPCGAATWALPQTPMTSPQHATAVTSPTRRRAPSQPQLCVAGRAWRHLALPALWAVQRTAPVAVQRCNLHIILFAALSGASCFLVRVCMVLWPACCMTCTSACLPEPP